MPAGASELWVSDSLEYTNYLHDNNKHEPSNDETHTSAKDEDEAEDESEAADEVDIVTCSALRVSLPLLEP